MQEHRRKEYIGRIIKALSDVQIVKAALGTIHASRIAQSVQILRIAMEDAHPAEIAQAMRNFDPEAQKLAVAMVPPEKSSRALLALRDIDEEAGIELAEQIQNDKVAEILNVMEPDDAADVLADLPEQAAAQVLANG
jgi:Mg/Co/Ni transporter MgtE